jgi:hypothetical protein
VELAPSKDGIPLFCAPNSPKQVRYPINPDEPESNQNRPKIGHFRLSKHGILRKCAVFTGKNEAFPADIKAFVEPYITVDSQMLFYP